MFYRLLKKATDVAIPIDAGDFRLDVEGAFPTSSRRCRSRDHFIRGMVASVGFKADPFEYDRQRRCRRNQISAVENGELRGRRVPWLFDDFASVFLTLPRGRSLIVLVLVAIYSLHSWLNGDVIPGWTSLMISIIVASFFQLIALSIIGEYVGRIYLSTKARPLFIIDAIRRSPQTGRPASLEPFDLHRQSPG